VNLFSPGETTMPAVKKQQPPFTTKAAGSAPAALLPAARATLDRRLDSQSRIATEVAAWEKKRNSAKARIHWTFTLAAARRKLRKTYPSIED
jgi:hypothetical protein